MRIAFSDELENSQTILLAGAGGGFDIYSGIPLYFKLKEMGKEVVIANYSFSFLRRTGSQRIGSTGYLTTSLSADFGYFPERYLMEWLARTDEHPPIIGVEKSGVKPLAATYRAIVEKYGVDTIILVDGGTDSLMTGDESGLGTPTEDATSIMAANQIKGVRKFLLAIGFGIDEFHGVNHYHFLENVAKLAKRGGYLGCFSITGEEKAGLLFKGLVAYANKRLPGHQSIVANSIKSALEGEFGDYHATPRTRGSKLFINPLMGIYWAFHLDKIVERLLYAPLIENSRTEQEVKEAIVEFRTCISPRGRDKLPY